MTRSGFFNHSVEGYFSYCKTLL